MSKSGKVKSWKKSFGFAEMDDGTLVWIHASEIGDGRLRIGLSVKFDTEEVEGHNGRLKGTNVTGPAILAKGEKLSEEEIEADKKRLAEAREAQKQVREETKEQNKKDLEPVKELVDTLSRKNKTILVKKLSKELEIPIVYKKDKEDRRADPTQRGGPKYTKAEFIAFYGQKNGLMMWNRVGPAKKGGAKKKDAKKAEE